MSAHTPGPWTVLNNGTSDEPMLSVGIKRGRGLRPLEVAICATGDVDQKAENANARLIAAAPDLLAALRDAMDIIDDEVCAPYTPGEVIPSYARHFVERLEKIRAAIRKATEGQS